MKVVSPDPDYILYRVKVYLNNRILELVLLGKKNALMEF